MRQWHIVLVVDPAFEGEHRPVVKHHIGEYPETHVFFEYGALNGISTATQQKADLGRQAVEFAFHTVDGRDRLRHHLKADISRQPTAMNEKRIVSGYERFGNGLSVVDEHDVVQKAHGRAMRDELVNRDSERGHAARSRIKAMLFPPNA